jgi:hypothetical protein
MDGYLTSTTARLRSEERLREAERRRLIASVREPHAWRHRLGQGLIRVGRALDDEPAEKAARPRARMA